MLHIDFRYFKTGISKWTVICSIFLITITQLTGSQEKLCHLEKQKCSYLISSTFWNSNDFFVMQRGLKTSYVKILSYTTFCLLALFFIEHPLLKIICFNAKKTCENKLKRYSDVRKLLLMYLTSEMASEYSRQLFCL